MISDVTYDYDVFLSHATNDKPQVEELARRLKVAGLKPFLDKWHLVPGEPGQEAIETAMSRSRTCVVFVGPGLLGPWQNEEMRNALALRVKDDSRRVIPVLLPGASDSGLPPFLKQLTWVDFRSGNGLDDPHAFHRLVCGIKGIEPGEGPTGTERSQSPPVEISNSEYTLLPSTLSRGGPRANRDDSQGMQKPLVFISHSSSDKPFATRLAEALRERDIEIWIDHEQIRYGDSIARKIADGLRRCDVLLVLASASFEASSWCRNEYEPILTHEISDNRIRVIALRLDDTPLPELLSHKRFVDLRAGFEITFINDLASDIKSLANRSTKVVERVASLPGSPEVPSTTRNPVSPRWRRWLRMSLLMVTLAVVPGDQNVVKIRPKVPLTRPSVAVLSFENHTGRGDLAWLSEGLAEVVSAKLGMAGDVRSVDRRDVSLTETDLLLFDNPQAEISPQNLNNIRGLLGVDFVLGGVYRIDGSSPIRLDLTLYDTRNGLSVAQAGAQADGKENTSFDWIDLADRSTELLLDPSLRHRLDWPPSTPSQKERLRALFPVTTPAMKFYTQGLKKYRHFDIPGASEFLSNSVKLEAHPLVFAALANTHAALGQFQEGREAIRRARRLGEQDRNKSQALPERYWREMEIIERKVAPDEVGAANLAQVAFREFFPDDLSYGIRAAQFLIAANTTDRAEAFLKELRLLPLAEDHPVVEFLEADALLARQQYSSAQEIAMRAVEKAQKLGAIRQEALARLQLASILSHMGYRSEAAKQFRTARVTFKKTGDPRSAAQCAESTALLYTGFDPNTAVALYRNAILEYERLGDRQEQGRVLRDLRGFLIQIRMPAEADEIKDQMAALGLPMDEDMEQGSAQSFYEGDLEQARKELEDSIASLDKNEQPDNAAILLANLGEIELMLGELAKAQDHYSRAVEIHETIGSEVTPFDLVGLGRVFMAKGEYPPARIRYKLALDWLESRGDASETGDIGLQDIATWTELLLAMAELELLTGNAEESEKRVQDVLDRAVVDLYTVRSRAFSLRARRLLDERKPHAAWEAAREAVNLAPGDVRAVREAKITEACVDAELDHAEPAIQRLYEIAKDSADRKHVIYELESRLRAGEIELKKLGRGRDRLEELRERAAKLNFGQIVRRAESALKNN